MSYLISQQLQVSQQLWLILLVLAAVRGICAQYIISTRFEFRDQKVVMTLSALNLIAFFSIDLIVLYLANYSQTFSVFDSVLRFLFLLSFFCLQVRQQKYWKGKPGYPDHAGATVWADAGGSTLGQIDCAFECSKNFLLEGEEALKLTAS